MPLLPPNYLDCVVAIGVGRDPAKRQWIGTGFFYGLDSGETDDKGNKFYTVFLVSNKHVFEGLKTAYIKLNSHDGTSSKDYEIDLIAKNGKELWIGHPDTEVDVAASWINAGFLSKDQRKFSFFVDESQVLDSDTLAASSVSEGDDVFLLGFPMGMVDRVRQYTICRSGSIARISDVKAKQSKEILVDGLVFPGNSGGPVVTKPELLAVSGQEPYRSAHLLGVVSYYVPYQDVARSDQTKRPRMIFEENSGLTSVVPAQFVRETVILGKNRLKNRIAQRKHQAKKKKQQDEQADAADA